MGIILKFRTQTPDKIYLQSPNEKIRYGYRRIRQKPKEKPTQPFQQTDEPFWRANRMMRIVLNSAIREAAVCKSY